MKIVTMFGGHSIAVYNPDTPGKKELAEKLQQERRANFVVPSIYNADSKAYKVVTAIIDKIRIDQTLKELAK